MDKWFADFAGLVMPRFDSSFCAGLPFKKSRDHAIKGLIVACSFIVSCSLGFWLSFVVKDHALESLAERGNVLVSAIAEYEKTNGSLPSKLDDLVPAFLPKMPETDMAAHPKYKYLVGKEANNYAGNPWVLVVDMPQGAINWDQFVFLPRQNYAEYRDSGNALTQFGRWAYVHE